MSQRNVLARRVLGLLAVAAIVLAGIVAWRLLSGGGSPSNVITLSGRIEGDDSALAPNIGGRVAEVRVREGDSVSTGQVIVVIDGAQVRAREAQARAATAAAAARVGAAQEQVGVLGAQVAAADADLAQSRALYRLAAFNESSDVALFRTGDISEEQERAAIASAQQAAASVALRAAQTAAVERQIAQQRATIASASAEMRQAAAQLAEARANRSDLVVRAPFSGTVITRAVEPGEVVAAGTPVATLLNLDRVYLRGFIPEGEIGRVKIGQPARVYLDSNPDRPIDAYVLRIDPQATFTPENTYFRNDRVREVFGVKLALRSGFGFAKPGMPADGEILISGTWPSARPPS
ncbi:MAG TPA: HlyD family efflux transporter periplasmic adaptor subunit [Candidatus Dormibacteraeota bacterium]|nr:HlyD family efflux transporter periplasmic adaptor subunit [Candidatus Dormibacteraeota bacterium]